MGIGSIKDAFRKAIIEKDVNSTIIRTYIDEGLLANTRYDYFSRALSGSDNEIETWTYRDGGSGGTVVAVIVATYTDSYRDDLVSVDRTT